MAAHVLCTQRRREAAIFHLIALRSAAKCPIDFSAAAASRLASGIDRPAGDDLRATNSIIFTMQMTDNKNFEAIRMSQHIMDFVTLFYSDVFSEIGLN